MTNIRVSHMIHKIDLKYYIIISIIASRNHVGSPRLVMDYSLMGLQLIVMDPTSVSVWISDAHPITRVNTDVCIHKLIGFGLWWIPLIYIYTVWFESHLILALSFQEAVSAYPSEEIRSGMGQRRKRVKSRLSVRPAPGRFPCWRQ